MHACIACGGMVSQHRAAGWLTTPPEVTPQMVVQVAEEEAQYQEDPRSTQPQEKPEVGELR